MKDLPIGVQSFEDMRSRNFLYIDKTEHIYRIATTGKVYFLSRPHRFGRPASHYKRETAHNNKRDGARPVST